MKFIIYSPICTQCRYRVALQTIQNYMFKNGDSYEIRNTAFSVQNKRDAQSIGQALPFVYNADSKLATDLLGVTYESLDRIRGI